MKQTVFPVDAVVTTYTAAFVLQRLIDKGVTAQRLVMVSYSAAGENPDSPTVMWERTETLLEAEWPKKFPDLAREYVHWSLVMKDAKFVFNKTN